jgi:hypothetical protein
MWWLHHRLTEETTMCYKVYPAFQYAATIGDDVFVHQI